MTTITGKFPANSNFSEPVALGDFSRGSFVPNDSDLPGVRVFVGVNTPDGRALRFHENNAEEYGDAGYPNPVRFSFTDGANALPPEVFTVPAICFQLIDQDNNPFTIPNDLNFTIQAA